MSEYRSYTEQMTVLDGDSDFRRCLKPSALFRYVEQVSADHARAYGMDHAFFRERRSAFLVGKQALRVWRMPGRAEKINLTTACEAFKKGTMKRLTTITSETGEKLALVDCRWMIVDTETGRILRTPGWTMPDFQNDDLPEELPQIVHKSQPLTAAGERRASYSMCDLNGHINNSLYLDIACDALPQEVVESAPLSFASIKYHREVPMGQTVQVFYAPSGNGWYLLGRREEHAAFECYLEFGSSVTESLQNNYKEITKTIAKVLQKSYNMVTERARPFWIMKSFSSCFWNIGCPPSSSGCSPSQLPADTAQAIFRFVCKRVRLVSDGLFCVRKSGKIGPQQGKV